MRYLKVVVKDKSSNAQADTVKLFFFQRDPKLPDELIREATAVDASADGAVDYQMTGDIDGNGRSDQQDRQLLKYFANNVLKLEWLSKFTQLNRSINIYVSRFDPSTIPVEVRLDLYQNEKPMIDKDKLVLSITAYDDSGKGNLQFDEGVLPRDVFDTVDRETLQHMARLYLKFNWR
ncbi:hypothetical protein LRQ11_17980 [Pseudomonas sp. MAFF 311095]|uniref:Uncharacterized protein n=1 Tax=Pseudomonas petroselini TaxID=2899822 RepID=A0ABS8QQ67_9PSED|nr:hypothetical protein [Pseudomonas petroselini]MCD7037605.1 hypothetical protein [Pseudomonas petroselini]MCD7048090.1 hypothetical protein [Pseudomonas petroselini]MCD7071376.1 hypothetical protein [Pseudomonas petroselini]MCD7080611.1 hypothetical protein [Pseudomonas petroselini]